MSRDWCFTSFTTDKEINFEKDKIKYIIYGREKCPTSNREHYQGFACFIRTCRIPKAKEWLGGDSGIHLEPRRGTRDQARDYCRKDGEFIEWGRYDRRTLTELLREDISIIKEEDPLLYVRYHRGIEKLQNRQGDKWRDVNVTVLYGKTGTGKTRKVMEMDNVYKIDPPYSWWDGYMGESILLIDDFRIGSIPRGMLLNLLDGYRMRLETKGGHTWALWDKIYITTNFDPEMWEDAIRRRINDIVTM